MWTKKGANPKQSLNIKHVPSDRNTQLEINCVHKTLMKCRLY